MKHETHHNNYSSKKLNLSSLCVLPQYTILHQKSGVESWWQWEVHWGHVLAGQQRCWQCLETCHHHPAPQQAGETGKSHKTERLSCLSIKSADLILILLTKKKVCIRSPKSQSSFLFFGIFSDYRVSSKTVPTWLFALLSASTHANCKSWVIYEKFRKFATR